jgi:hypothetical protein
MVEQLQHVADVLRVLDHKVQLHVEFATHQLKQVKTKELSIFSFDRRFSMKTINNFGFSVRK